jgi:hypothetical protein
LSVSQGTGESPENCFDLIHIRKGFQGFYAARFNNHAVALLKTPDINYTRAR